MGRSITSGLQMDKRLSPTKWLFMLCWIQYTVVYWSCVILNKVPLFIYITPYVFPILLAVTLYMWLKATNFKMDIMNITVLIVALVIWFVSRARHPEYLLYFDENAQRCLEAFLMLYVGKSVFYGGVEDGDYALLVKLSRAGIALTTLYFVYGALTGRITEQEYMTIAYRTLPSTLCLASAFLKDTSAKNILWFIFAAMLQLFMGTRGAVLAIVVFIVVYFLLFAEKKTFFIVLLCAGVFMIFDAAFGLIELLLIGVSFICASFNMSTRIFDAILTNNLTDDNGRNKISEYIIGRIDGNIWTGEGLFADRYLLTGFPGDTPYAHNIVLEMWANFGLIPCIAILVVILIAALRKMLDRRVSEYERLLLAISFSAAMTQLMFTGSYLTDASFWLFIGMLWGMYRYNKTNSRIHIRLWN